MNPRIRASTQQFVHAPGTETVINVELEHLADLAVQQPSKSLWGVILDGSNTTSVEKVAASGNSSMVFGRTVQSLMRQVFYFQLSTMTPRPAGSRRLHGCTAPPATRRLLMAHGCQSCVITATSSKPVSGRGFDTSGGGRFLERLCHSPKDLETIVR